MSNAYDTLSNELDAAFQQAASGKGAERHATGEPFEQQPILTITRSKGVGFPLGQVDKKTDEAAKMIARGELSAARRELHGAIIYLAATCLRLKEQGA